MDFCRPTSRSETNFKKFNGIGSLKPMWSRSTTLYFSYQEADRREIGGHFRAISEMARPEFMPWLIRVASESGLDLAPQFQGKSCAQEMVFWTFLNCPAIFEEARTLAHWERLPRRSMEKRDGLPAMTPQITTDALNQFGWALPSIFSHIKVRGEHCKVEHLLRSGHIDFFFAFPADYADVLIGYEDNGDFSRRQWKPAFEVIVLMTAWAGTVQLYAEGTKDVRTTSPRSSREPFCRSTVNHIGSPNRPTTFSCCCSRAFHSWRRRRTICAGSRLNVRRQKHNSAERILFDTGQRRARQKYPRRHRRGTQLNKPAARKFGCDPGTFQAAFETGRKRPKSISFTVTLDGCTLRDSDEELTLRRCLRQWQIAS